jgi:hypothetical protein
MYDLTLEHAEVAWKWVMIGSQSMRLLVGGGILGSHHCCGSCGGDLGVVEESAGE